MKPCEILKDIENSYASMLPPQENSVEAFVWFCDVPHPLFNSVTHLSTTRVKDKVEELIKLAPPNQPISFWIHEENRAEGLVPMIEELGFKIVAKCPLMARFTTPSSLPIADVRPAHTDMEAFHRISQIVFENNDQVQAAFVKLLAKIESENYLIYLDGKPVGTGILCPHGKVGVIHNIGVLSEYAKKGAGRAMMQFLIHRANQLQLERVTLLSSSNAERFYLHLGFSKIFDIDIYAQ